MLGVMGIVLLALRFFRIHQKNKKPPTPLTCDILRGPGQSLLMQIDSLNQEIRVYSIALFTFPVLIFCTHVSYSYFGGQPDSWSRIAMSAGGTLVFMGYFLLRLMPRLSRRRLQRLSYEGKVVAGQELNLLMSDGYRIFHDFPADSFNIDHIVVGSTGVMAVKTKTCKVRNPNRMADALVAYDGRMLHFPKFSDFETIEQANHQAEWLSGWLSSTAGEDVAARAMVALPGWSVKRTSADGIPVVNPKQFATLFKHIKPRPMSESLMQSIIRQIEGQCHS